MIDFLNYSVLFSFLSVPSNIASAESKSSSIPRSEIVEIGDIKTERIYPLFIKLPRSYNRKTRQHYPVIYLTDTTRFPMNTGKIQEAIIVGIYYEKGAKGDTSRVRDYTPHKASAWKKKQEVRITMQHLSRIMYLSILMKTIELIK